MPVAHVLRGILPRKAKHRVPSMSCCCDCDDFEAFLRDQEQTGHWPCSLQMGWIMAVRKVQNIAMSGPGKNMT